MIMTILKKYKIKKKLNLKFLKKFFILNFDLNNPKTQLIK